MVGMGTAGTGMVGMGTGTVRTVMGTGTTTIIESQR